MLFHLIYVSTAVLPMTDDALVELLRQSRAHNEQNQITGLLLYKDGNFMEVLKGDEATVMEVFASVEGDVRQKSIDVLRAEFIAHRDFPDWTMGFKTSSTLDPSTTPGYTLFLEPDVTADYLTDDSVEAYAMLLAFKGSPKS
jgi:hypothetical protein